MSDKKYSNLHPRILQIDPLGERLSTAGMEGGAGKNLQKHVFKNNKNRKKEIIIKASNEAKARKIFKEKHSDKGVHVYSGIRKN